MNKEDLKRKLSSRKFWIAVALFVSGVFTAFGKADIGEKVYGLIMQAAAVIAYIVAEGLVDARNKKADEHGNEDGENQ